MSQQRKEKSSSFIDDRLKYLSDYARPKEHIGHGMIGSIQVFDKINNKDFYKGKAAFHILRLRQVRQWHIENKGRDAKPETYARLLADAAYCRNRASGKIPMPQIRVQHQF